MEIRARKKAADLKEVKKAGSRPPVIQLPRARGGREDRQEEVERFSAVIAIRCNTMLYNTIQNAVTASQTAQDFTYSSPSDYIRAALQAHRDGMVLTELDEKGPKMSTTLRVDQETKEFYSSLPDRSRSKILERAIRTFMKNPPNEQKLS